jgi:flavodoxin
MENSKKNWEQGNKHLTSLKRKRNKYKERLCRYGMLPKTYPYTKVHEEMMDKIKSNQFEDLKILMDLKRKEMTVEKRILNTVKKKTLYVPVDPNIAKRERRLVKVIEAGLIPETYTNLETELQKEIYDFVMNHLDVNIKDIIHTYINDTNLKTKQRYLYNKLRIKVNQPIYKNKGKHVNIRPEDIIVNEYCPFLGVKIDYRTIPSNMFLNNSHSFDRIVNCKGYVTGNVWVISRLANTMKNEATDEQLKTFCKNILLMYARKTNTGI